MNKLDDLITDEFNMKIDDDIDVDEHVILPTITEHQDEEMQQSQHDMTDNLNDSLSDTKSLIVKNPNPFTNLTNMDDSFLEEERKAIEETSILDEFQDELSENHRPTHSLRDYSFEEFQQDIVENVILKKERILDIETNEDEVTKHFYSNEKTTSKPAEETDFLDMDVVENHQITQQDDNNQGVISESDENQTDNRNLLKKNNSMTSVVDSLDETVNNENEQSTPQIENLEAPIVSTDSKNEKDKLYNDVSISSLKQQSNEITPTILTTQTPKTRSQSDKKTSLSTKSKTSKPKLAILENTTINVKQKQQQPIVKSRLNFDEVERILSMHKRDVSPNKVQNRLFIPTSDIFHKDDLLTRRPSNFETEYFRMFVKPLEKKRVPIPSTSITRTFIKKSLIKSYSGLLPNMGGKNTSIGGSAMIQGSVEKRSRSLSEKRLAAKMAKEVEPLPNQPYLWHTFSTKYAPNKQQKKHVSWSPVREYIHDGRTNDDDRRTTRHTNDISQNKPIKQTKHLFPMRGNQRISRSDTSNNIQPISTSFIPVLDRRTLLIPSSTKFSQLLPLSITTNELFLTPTVHTPNRTIMEQKDLLINNEISPTTEIPIRKHQTDLERYYDELGDGQVIHSQPRNRLLQTQRFPLNHKSDDRKNILHNQLRDINNSFQKKMNTMGNYVKKIYPTIFIKTPNEQENKLKQYDRLLEKMRITDEQLQSLKLPWSKDSKEKYTSTIENINSLDRSKRRTISSYFSPWVLQTIFIILFILNMIIVYYFNELNILWKQFQAESIEDDDSSSSLDQKISPDTNVH